MKKIYLFCSAGMSTSILASNMQDVANQYKLPIEVAAFPHNKLDEIINTKHPDCILLGPQVKYMYEETIEQFGHLDTPIAVIDAEDYGMMNGEKVLKMAVKLIKANTKGG
ncbi:MAG: PTS sugar transporter subunit IIB [Coprobacillaceae bacterium]